MAIVFIFIHAFMALYIDRLSYAKTGKSTNWELVPFANVYLIGKYAYNRIIGAILFVCLFFVVKWEITLLGAKYGLNIIPPVLRTILFVLYLIIIIGVLIHAVGEYNRLTENKDPFKWYDLVYFIKETIWLIVLFVAIYLFAIFIRRASIS